MAYAAYRLKVNKVHCSQSICNQTPTLKLANNHNTPSQSQTIKHTYIHNQTHIHSQSITHTYTDIYILTIKHTQTLTNNLTHTLTIKRTFTHRFNKE